MKPVLDQIWNDPCDGAWGDINDDETTSVYASAMVHGMADQIRVIVENSIRLVTMEGAGGVRTKLINHMKETL